MKKNHKIHLLLDQELAEKLKKESAMLGLSVCELCRQKLSEDYPFKQIESTLEKILRRLE